MSNPFRFGTPVEESFLIGREDERAALIQELRDGQNLALIAPRGTGKTSLLRSVLAHCANDIDGAYADLFPAINTRRFAEIYAGALTLEPNSTVKDMEEAVRHLVPRFQPRVTITSSGRPGLQLDLWDRDRDMRALLDRILAAPGELPKQRGKPLAVVFDDFEDLISVAEKDVLRDLAAAARRHARVSYVFVLRKESTFKNTFGSSGSPFFRLAEASHLEPVPADVMRKGILARFESRNVRVEEGLIPELQRLADNVPHYVQMLAHSLYEEARDEGRADAETLRAAVAHVLESQSYAFKLQWDQLSPFQRNLTLAIAQGITDGLHSQRMVTKLGLGSPSTVSKNLRVLSDREILRRSGSNIRFVDPFFGLWLLRRMT